MTAQIESDLDKLLDGLSPQYTKRNAYEEKYGKMPDKTNGANNATDVFAIIGGTGGVSGMVTAYAEFVDNFRTIADNIGFTEQYRHIALLASVGVAAAGALGMIGTAIWKKNFGPQTDNLLVKTHNRVIKEKVSEFQQKQDGPTAATAEKTGPAPR